MGTNYYLATTNKEVKERYFKNYSLTDEPVWAYEIHIAKISGGSMPLFQAHDGAFNSYTELRELATSGDFILYNEDHQVLTWTEFDSIVQGWMNHKDELESHIGRGYCRGYYKDLKGYEFTREEFC